MDRILVLKKQDSAVGFADIDLYLCGFVDLSQDLWPSVC